MTVGWVVIVIACACSKGSDECPDSPRAKGC
jgi:hypothetical protein